MSCPVSRARRYERMSFGAIMGMAPYAGMWSKLALRSITLSTQYVSKPHGSRMGTYWVDRVMLLKANLEHIPAYGAMPMIAPKDVGSRLPARLTGQDEDLVAAEATCGLDTYWVDRVMLLKANLEHIPAYGAMPMICLLYTSPSPRD